MKKRVFISRVIPMTRLSRILPMFILPMFLSMVGLANQPLDFSERVIVGYWHNWENNTAPFIFLRNVPNQYNVVNVSFIETPGSGQTGYGYQPVFQPIRNHYPTDQSFKDEVASLQTAGVKVLISIGGQNGHIVLNNDTEKNTYVNGVIEIVEKYGFDGIDIDYEGSSMTALADSHKSSLDYDDLTNTKLILAIDAIREIHQHFTDKGQEFIVTAAPEIAYVQDGNVNPLLGQFLPVLHNIRDILDYVHVQLYNFGSAVWSAKDGARYDREDPDLLVALTEMMITGFNLGNTAIQFPGLRADQVAVGLPASPNGAGAVSTDTPNGYYFPPSKVVNALMYLMNGISYEGTSYTLENPNGYPDLRGIMTWSANWDKTTDGGTEVYEFSDYNYNYFSELSSSIPTKISIQDASAFEGTSGAGSLFFTVLLSKAADEAVTVEYNTAEGTATAGEDYTDTFGTLTFEIGETNKTIEVEINGDTLEETDETLTVVLSDVSTNAILLEATATGTILDDDTPVSISIADAITTEGDSTATVLTFTVSLSRTTQQPLTVVYNTEDGTATAGEDYTATSGTLTIPAQGRSATVTVQITNDEIDEGSEYFSMVLSNPAENTILSRAQATGTILDDDGVIPRFSGQAMTSDHRKQVIGYLTQYDPWKAGNNSLDAQGLLNQANVDFSKYTIINFSFFGVAGDGSLHSADYGESDRWKNRDLPRDQWNEQDPKPLLHEDLHSSWDYYVLFGDLKLKYSIDAEADAAGFSLQDGDSSRWYWAEKDLSGVFPAPVPDPDGAPGLFKLGEQHGVKILASLGGWSLSQHFPDLNDPAKRARFVEDCQKLIMLGFDGIDIDWEFPDQAGMNFTGTQEDYETFAVLMEAIREGIGPDKLLTAAFHSVPAYLDGYDWDRLQHSVDYFNFFGYDLAGGWSNVANHNAPLHPYDNQDGNLSLSGAITYLKDILGVPANKINMGLPSFGRGVVTSASTATVGSPTVKTQVNFVPDGPVETAADLDSWPHNIWDGTPMYYHIKSVYQADTANQWQRYWDDKAKVPYLVNGNKFLSYDDPESIAYKVKHYAEEDLAGIIVWTAVGDLELGPLDTNYDGKLKVASTVRSDLIDTVNNVFAGIAEPEEYSGFDLPDESVLVMRLADQRTNQFFVTLKHESDQLNEGIDTHYTGTVTLSKSLDHEFTVEVATIDDTAKAGEDFSSINQTLTFQAGETNQSVSIEMIDDETEENRERFYIALSNPSNLHAEIDPGQYAIEIIDDETPALISIRDGRITEGDPDTQTLSFTVSLSRIDDEIVTVNYATHDGTATAEKDYARTSGTLTFSGENTTETISVQIIDDGIDESFENFSVVLSNPVGNAEIEDGEAIGTILDDDENAAWTRHYTPSSDIIFEALLPTQEWSNGFSGRLRLTNNGPALSTWRLTFDAPWTTTGSGNDGGWTIQNEHHSVIQPSWSGYTFASGTSINLDFTGQGTWSAPTHVLFNGAPADGSGADNVKLVDWMAEHGIVDLEQDSDQNTQPDLIDFLLGNTPGVGTNNTVSAIKPRIIAFTIDGQTDDYFCVEIDIDPLSENIEYRIELSDDLTRWQAGEELIAVEEDSENADGSLTVTWRSKLPVSAMSKRFARLAARTVENN